MVALFCREVVWAFCLPSQLILFSAILRFINCNLLRHRLPGHPVHFAKELTLKRMILVAAAFCLLASCGSEPLSETECRALIEKEISFAINSMPPDPDNHMREFMRKGIDSKVSSCVSSQKSSREYYQCMVDTRNQRETGMCIDAENKRIGLTP
jgi:hypothetical protein